MEKEFVIYEIALELKELGFDEPCFGYYDHQIKELDTISSEVCERLCKHDTDIKAPTYSAALRWFREKYDLNSLVVFDKYICEIDDKELENPYFTYYYSINELWSEGKDYGKFTRGFINVASNRDMLSYEEAELACLKKLIQIVKQK